MNHAPLAPLSDWRGRREGRSSFLIDLDAGNRDWQAAMDSLPPLGHSWVAWLAGENLVQLVFAPSWPDSNLEQDRERLVGRINYWSRWIWAPLIVVCVVATVLQWRRQRERLPALLLTFFIVQGLFPLAVAEGRYRKPFEGLLIAQCLLLASGVRGRPGGPFSRHRV